MTINQRIAALRQQMAINNLAAYIIPSSDPHQSEYVADHWKSREWISGFTGSAGIAIILKDAAALWTDSRYFLQAEEQLKDSEMVFHKQGIPHAPDHQKWLAETLHKGDKVGVDGQLFSLGQLQSLEKILKNKGIEIVADIDLIPSIWEDRPLLPEQPIFEHDAKYAGRTRTDKIEMVQEHLINSNCQHYLVSTLDDIAWVFNLRGRDVASNPVFYAYALISEKSSILYINEKKISDELKSILAGSNISIKPYHQLKADLGQITGSILIDKSSTSHQVYHWLQPTQIQQGKNIIRQLKAIKNKTEIEHIKHAMLKDGVALTRLYIWLWSELDERSVPETEVAEQLIAFRRAQGEYFGESFDAIVGYQGNGAIVHYRAHPDTCASLKKEGILLLDSGGQYLDGTTDITRTFALGQPTAAQKRNFTLVLKGHIAVDSAKFPHGTTGTQLDTLARINLWKQGLDYGHGTGHGVGFFLNVHEPPQGFATSPTTSRGLTAIVPGMFTSNEPGFYQPDEYGIRIENLILCVEDEVTDFGQFYRFENLTLFPIDLNLVDKSILTTEEINWLNAYHQKVERLLSPLLENVEKEWLKEACRQL